MRRTTSNAAPPAVRSTSDWSRCGGGERPDTASRRRGRGVTAAQRDADLARAARARPPSRGTSSRRAMSSSTGVAASAGDTVRRAFPVVPSPPLASTWSSSARARGLIAASRLLDVRCPGRATSGAARSRRRRRRPRSASATPLSARRPPGDSQTSARSDQALDRGLGRVGLGVHDLGRVRVGGLVCNHEGIKHGELETSEVVERSEDRGSSGSSRGQLRGVVRCRSGEIRTVLAAAPRGGHRASGATGLPASAGAPVPCSTSLLRYSPGPCRGSSSTSMRRAHEAG